MIDKLYIIGNGFDRHHGLRTSYEHFREDFLKKKVNSLLWKRILEIYGNAPKQDDYWWKDFENMLGRVDYVSLAMSENGEAMGFMKVRNLMKGVLPPLFGKWIKQVERQSDMMKIKIMDEVERNSMFFTFNYTLLLEKVYKVEESRVWHIHGSVKQVDDIKVGHDSDAGQFVSYTQEYIKNHPEISPSYADQINLEALNGAKNVHNIIYLNNDNFDQYCDIKHFIAMGFSFNDIDMPYIRKIIEVNRNISDTDWTLYYHDEGKDQEMIDKLLNEGIRREQIKTPIYW